MLLLVENVETLKKKSVERTQMMKYAANFWEEPVYIPEYNKEDSSFGEYLRKDLGVPAEVVEAMQYT